MNTMCTFSNLTKIFFLVLFLSFLTNSFVYSQLLPKRALESPQKYITPTESDDIVPVSPTERKIDEPWIVFSDREKNETSSTPGGDDVKRQFGYLEKFYVAGEQGEYLWLVKDPQLQLLDLSEMAQDWGWIHKSKLMLWTRCLHTKVGQISRKAMVLNTINELKKKKGGAPDLVEFQKSPLVSGGKTGKTSKLFQFFFVYKIDNSNGMALLSKSDDMSVDDEERRNDEMVGWAPMTRLTMWNHRKALEPNWEPAAAEERKGSKKVAKIFADEPSAKKYKSGATVPDDRIIWSADSFETRMIGEWRRFPILTVTDKKDPDILQIGAMGDIYLGNDSRVGDTKVSADRMARIQKSVGNIVAERRNVSIIFIIDGTNSMGPYFQSMAAAIQQCMVTLQEDSRSTYKFGATIYRDYAEGEERLVEVLPLQSDYQKVVSFLDPSKAKDIYDIDKPEAVNYGIMEALRSSNIDPLEANFVILVGDAGNHHRDDKTLISPSRIVNILNALNCNFIVFQVHHDGDKTYDEFSEQMKDVLYETAIKKAEDIGWEKPRLEENGRTYKLFGSPLPSAVFGLLPGKTLDKDKLTSEVVKAIQNLKSLKDTIVKTVSTAIEEGGNLDVLKFDASNASSTKEKNFYTSSFAPGIKHLLKQAGVSNEDLQVLQQSKYQLYTEAAVTMRVRDRQYPLFKHVLLLTKLEFATMIRELKNLSNANDDRIALMSAWKEILKKYLGDVDERELSKLTLEEVNKRVFGLPGTSEFLKVPLMCISDQQCFPREKLRKYVEDIRKKSKMLQDIFDIPEGQYSYSFRSGVSFFYWIQEDLIP